MPRVILPDDFRLWLYRDRCKLSWAALARQPAWRTAQDVHYLALESLAQAWHAAQAKKQQRAADQDRHFADVIQRGKQAMGLIK